MPVARIFPYSYKPGSGLGVFTDAQIANLMGNNPSTITQHNGNIYTNIGMYATLFFDTTVVPENATVNYVTAYIYALCFPGNLRSFYSISAWHPSYGPISGFNETLLTTSDSYASISSASFKTSWPINAIRNNQIEWDFCILSKSNSTVITQWKLAFIDVDYTPAPPPASGASRLFIGENF